MNLSKRELLIVYVTMIVVSIFVLDRYIVTPFLDSRARVEAGTESVQGEMDRASSLFARRRQMGQKWKDMLAGGLKGDPSETESQVLHAVRNWSQSSGIILASVKPERIAARGELRQIMFVAAGTGNMSSVAQFLWQLENSPLPVKIVDLQMGSRKEGTDDLSVQVRISALYLAAEAERAREAAPARPTEGDME